MARIVGGIATSHTPTIGFALDGNKQQDPVWRPIFEAYEPIKAWLKEKQPDVLFLIYNDHVTSFFFDHYSAFVLGVGDEWKVADEGGGMRKLSFPPYARYFMARIYQFQFYWAMCRAAGYTGPLNRCSVYGSNAAGDKFHAMLAMGASKPWPEALKEVTGEDRIDASAMVEYFQPLLDWLKEQNKGEKTGWSVESNPMKAR